MPGWAAKLYSGITAVAYLLRRTAQHWLAVSDHRSISCIVFIPQLRWDSRALSCVFAGAQAAEKPHLYQSPAAEPGFDCLRLCRETFGPCLAADAVRLTSRVGLESAPVFSPDSSSIAFTGEYDGNTDVFTIPASGGVPLRITYHPAADVAVKLDSDGKRIVFRSSRDAGSRYSQLYSVPVGGGQNAAAADGLSGANFTGWLAHRLFAAGTRFRL